MATCNHKFVDSKCCLKCGWEPSPSDFFKPPASEVVRPPFDFFYSDPHFGHVNIIKFCDRPFRSVEDQTEQLVERYNAVVKPTDFVLWCGDAAMGSKKDFADNISPRLNGHKALVKGNHDPKGMGACLALGFDWVVDEMFVQMGERTCRIKHYPYALTEAEVAELVRTGAHSDLRYPERRPPRVKGEVLIHGHTHSALKYRGNQVHVGIDAWNYAPVAWDEIEAIVATI